MHAMHTATANDIAVTMLPATAALPAVAAEPPTPALATVAAEPATPALATVATDPTTAVLAAVATDPTTAVLAAVGSECTGPPSPFTDLTMVFILRRVLAGCLAGVSTRRGAFRAAGASYRYQTSTPLHLEERDDMTTQHYRIATKILVSTAIAVGACVAGAAPASADPNPYVGFRCGCRETAPVGSPALMQEIERGLRAAHSAWLPGLPAPAESRRPPQ